MPRSNARLRWLLLAAAGGACAIAACTNERAPSTAEEAPAPPPPAPAPTGDVQEPNETKGGSSGSAPSTPEQKPPAPDLYDPDTIPEFELTLDPSAMATLMSATPETKNAAWVHGAFKFGGITFADVGVRLKGAETFRVLPNKASLKVKLNKWVKGQKLYGLEELTLNNMVTDRNFLRQRLTYHVFRSMGLPAQKANTAHLRINGEDYGIYANVETPDETFLRRVFGKKKVKSLYEAHTPGTWLPGSAHRWEIDIAAPSAPAGAMPDLDLLFQAVAAAKDETLLADLEPRLHTQQWLRFCATESVTGHNDGYAYGFWGSHNYYLAGDADGKFSILPWSTDATLNDDDGIPDASKPQSDVVLVRCSRSTTCWSAYKAEMQSVLATYATLDLVDLAHKWHGQIDALVKADPKREERLDQYEYETELLYEWLAARPNVIRAQLGL